MTPVSIPRLSRRTSTALLSYLAATAAFLAEHPELVTSVAGKLGATGAILGPIVLAVLPSLVKRPAPPAPAASAPVLEPTPPFLPPLDGGI